MAKTSQIAKWSAIVTLVIAGLYLALLFWLDRHDDGSGNPSVMLFVFMGVAILAMLAPVICIAAFIANRAGKKSGDDHVA